ncbi:MAG: NADH-quinone oxidoreductase subunit NuoN [Alphaproteobacteria bacterium]|nr:NADH-quinone oxidoreductase subunit NuoN [Alphaproteobacteria bacterium]
MVDLQSLRIVLPEVQLAIVGFVALIAAAAGGTRVTRAVGLLAIGGFALAGGTLFCPERLKFLLNGALPVFGFGTQFIDDSFARFVKALILAASALSVMLSWSYFEKNGEERPEYPVLILFATLGMMLMVSASDLLSLYVGLELQSLSLYVLAAFRRDDARSSEAGLKYFVLGALSSGLLLYGISLIYGYTGKTDFLSLASALRNHGLMEPGVVVGMAFICAALAFKVSGVPFHMWTPDVYEGAPTPVTAFFAAAPKMAALAMFTRFLLLPMNGLSAQWHQIIVFVSIASMLWGAFAGLVQGNMKRLLAYSSIANVGYLLVAVAVGGQPGVQAMLIYLSIYVLNTLGAFAVVLCLRRNGKAVDAIADLSGLSKTNPAVALAMTILMFSLAGVPPLAGFFGKYFVFLSAVDAGMVPLAIVGVLSSVVTAYYYLRIIKVMYFDEPKGALDPMPDWGVKSVLGLASLAMVVLTFVPSPLVDAALRAARGFIG